MVSLWVGLVVKELSLIAGSAPTETTTQEPSLWCEQWDKFMWGNQFELDQAESAAVAQAKAKAAHSFGLVPGLRVSKVSTVTGIGGVVVAKRRIVVALLDVSPVFVSQKCQQSRGSGGSWSRNAELS